MKKSKKFISLLLSFIMLLGITAGVNLSAYAEGSSLSFNYIQSGQLSWDGYDSYKFSIDSYANLSIDFDCGYTFYGARAPKIVIVSEKDYNDWKKGKDVNKKYYSEAKTANEYDFWCDDIVSLEKGDYRFIIDNSQGWGYYSADYTIYVTPVVINPNITYSVSDNSITLKLKNYLGTQGYYIDQLIDNKYVNIKSIQSEISQVKISNLKSKTVYCFRVRGYTVLNEKWYYSDWVNLKITTKNTNNVKLQAPTLKTTVNANGSFKLTWNKVSGAEKYELYIKQADGSYKLMKTTTGTAFTTAVGAYGYQYTYKMRAVKGIAKSAYSSAVNAKNTKKLQAPTAKVTVNANGSFKISWNKVSGAAKYGIYIKQADGTYKWMKTVTGTSFTTAVAAYGKQYSYKVLAATENNKSANTFSNVVNAKNTKKLQTPTLKAAVNKNGSFKLSWGKVTGAEKYELYIKQANGSYKLMKTTTSTSFTTAVAAKGKTYSYKVRAVTGQNKNAASNYSNAVNAKRK